MSRKEPWTHVEVLRLGHRPERDKRITTHVALAARAFGAGSIHVDRKDPSLERTIRSVTERFGGSFSIETGVSRRSVMGRFDGTIVHLTMYGIPVDRAVRELPEGEKILVVVGAEKVPADVYDLAHFNVSVANQPHSEVSALAIFLDRLFGGRELERSFPGGEVRIAPASHGKAVLPAGDGNGSVEIEDPFSMEWPPVPSEKECMTLLHMLGTSTPVMTHVREVHRMGMDMYSRSMEFGSGRDLDIDAELLSAGLLLHDIGRSRTHSIRHVTIGAELARRLHLDDRIVSIIHNHPGAGILASEAAELGLPEEDYIPVSLEERIVSHADNLVGESRRRPLERALERLRSKGALAAVERMKRLHEELEDILGIDIDALI